MVLFEEDGVRNRSFIKFFWNLKKKYFNLSRVKIKKNFNLCFNDG